MLVSYTVYGHIQLVLGTIKTLHPVILLFQVNRHSKYRFHRRRMTRHKVLFCYNNAYRQELDQLLETLISMVGKEHVSTWEDSRVLYNEEWEDELADYFDEAAIIVPLLGPSFLEDDPSARELFMEYIREVDEEGVYVMPWRSNTQAEDNVLPFVMNNPLDQASVSLDTPESQEAVSDRVQGFAQLAHGLLGARKTQHQPEVAAADDPEVLKPLADHLKAQDFILEAEVLYTQVLSIYRDRLGSDHIDTASSLRDLAVILEEQEAYSKAEPLQEHLVTLYRKNYGKTDARTARAINDLGGIYMGQERFREAQRACEEALRIRESTLGQDHPDTAESLHNQGVIYETLELIDRARTSYERALTIRETALGNEHPDTMTTVHSLARLYEEEGLDEKADAMYQRMFDASGEGGEEV